MGIYVLKLSSFNFNATPKFINKFVKNLHSFQFTDTPQTFAGRDFSTSFFTRLSRKGSISLCSRRNPVLSSVECRSSKSAHRSNLQRTKLKYRHITLNQIPWSYTTTQISINLIDLICGHKQTEPLHAKPR